MTDQLSLLTPDAGLSARSLARRVVDARSGVNITERCADVLPYLRRSDRPVTAHQLAAVMLGEGFDWAAPNTIARRLADLEGVRLARRLEQVDGTFGRARWLWTAVAS